MTPVPSDSKAISAEKSAIEQGLEFERGQLWSDAIRHYDEASRRFPTNKTLYQRLVICRLHYDVNRRYQDRSFTRSLREMGTGQALDLYSEILTNLQSHYVDSVDWGRVFLHGTAALEVALTEQNFLTQSLPRGDQAAIERFRQTIHQRLAGRSTATRFDLRANVAYVAQLAESEIGLPATATVLEYLGGAVCTLDPYTRLLSGDQLDEMFSNIEGNFVGLGVELRAETDCLQILSVIGKGPAEEAGILPGEKIVRVEQTHCAASDPDYVADLLRGPEHSFVSLTIVNTKGEPRDLRIERRRVEVPCIENLHFVDTDNRIGYLRLTSFQKSTTQDIERALWSLHQQGMKALILDLRGNPGGLLSASVEVADRFLSQGRIVSTRGRNARENFDYVAHRPNTWNVPLAVLIDSDSASASEIFAGAISDSGRGVIVGETSYGKGSVQGIFRMQSAKFGLCLTTAKFYSPKGRAISRNGVRPHVPVQGTYIAARPNDLGKLTLDREDATLQKAIAELVSSRDQISRRP